MNDNSVFAVYKLVLLKLNMFAIIYIIFFVGKFPIFEKQKPNLLIGIIIIIVKLNIEHSERVIESPSETISHLLVSWFPQQHWRVEFSNFWAMPNTCAVKKIRNILPT